MIQLFLLLIFIPSIIFSNTDYEFDGEWSLWFSVNKNNTTNIFYPYYDTNYTVLIKNNLIEIKKNYYFTNLQTEYFYITFDENKSYMFIKNYFNFYYVVSTDWSIMIWAKLNYELIYEKYFLSTNISVYFFRR